MAFFKRKLTMIDEADKVGEELPPIPETMIKRGDLVKDLISGYTGIVTCVLLYLAGCARICVQSKELKNGKPVDCQYFDDVQLEVIKEGAYFKKPVKVAAKLIRIAMAYKDTEVSKQKHKEWSHQHYLNNKEAYRLSHLRSKRKKVDEINDYKVSQGCAKCPEKRGPCLEFHHPVARNGKEPALAYLIRRLGKEKLWVEIKKCVVLCRNCHAMEHWNGKDYLPTPNDGVTKFTKEEKPFKNKQQKVK